MALTIILFCYFAPPLFAMCVGETFALWGSVWLFNLVMLFFWPVLIWFLPTSRH